MKKRNSLIVILALMVASIFLVIMIIPQGPKIKMIMMDRDLEALQKHLDSRQDPNQKFYRHANAPRTETTPLHYAASKGELEMAKLLLQYGANPNGVEYGGTNPLMSIFAFGESGVPRGEMIDLLWPVTNHDHVDNVHRSILHYIAMVGTKEEYEKYSSLIVAQKEALDGNSRTPESYFRDRFKK